MLRVHAAGIVDHCPFSRASVTVPLRQRDIEAVELPAEETEGKLHRDLFGGDQRRRGATRAEPQPLDLGGARDQVERDVAPREVE